MQSAVVQLQQVPAMVPGRIAQSGGLTSQPWIGRSHQSIVPHRNLNAGQVASIQAVASEVSTSLAQTYDPPKEAHGFILERAQYVAEYNSLLMFYKHQGTGAQVISVANDDENKTFNVTFRTPLNDNTGVAHVLEHSVLQGSEKYPIKDPFTQLIKGSLNTFINAFTSLDRTSYPVASANTQDFYNLVDVYLDSVLSPMCVKKPLAFKQEGWHLSLPSKEDEMVYKGVVFNEMKGAYSNPDSLQFRQMLEHLLPDSTYANDFGGDPKEIPNLTYEAFKDFHARYYHPSNGRFWFYGDDDPERRLQLLGSFLDKFQAREVEFDLKLQPLWSEPRSVEVPYPVGEGQPGRSYVQLCWVLSPDALPMTEVLALQFLQYLLMGTDAAPLAKALYDSGLGEELTGNSLINFIPQPVFAAGLKGVSEADVPKVESLILDTLQQLASTGFTQSQIESALNSTEFSLRENNTGGFPRGLSMSMRVQPSWLYGRDPLEQILWEKPLADFKARVAQEPGLFGELISKYLLNNTHRLKMVMKPDSGMAARQSEDEKQRLAAIRESKTEAELEEIVAATAALKAAQEEADPPELLAKIPVLTLADLPKTGTNIPTDVTAIGDSTTLLTHDLFTNNVVYFSLLLDAKTVPIELQPLLPLFTTCLTNMATTNMSFVELTEKIDGKTGGMSVGYSTMARKGEKEPMVWLNASGKAMSDKIPDLLDLMRDVLLKTDFSDQARFRQLVLESKSGVETSLVSAGHRYAGMQLSAQRTPQGYLNELHGGYSYLKFLRTIAKRIETDYAGIQADLEKIRDLVLSRNNAVLNITADKASLDSIDGHVRDFVASIPETSGDAYTFGHLLLPKRNIALTATTQVNYVAKGGNLYNDAGWALNGSGYVADKVLVNDWLYEQIRVQGGAYGAFTGFDPMSGNYTYMSYRDPSVLNTVKAYDGSANFLRNVSVEQAELSKYIIGTIGDIDSYMLPDAKGGVALNRYLLKITDEERQERREQVLGATQADVQAFADALQPLETSSVVAVTGPEIAAQVQKETGLFDEVVSMVGGEE